MTASNLQELKERIKQLFTDDEMWSKLQSSGSLREHYHNLSTESIIEPSSSRGLLGSEPISKPSEHMIKYFETSDHYENLSTSSHFPTSDRTSPQVERVERGYSENVSESELSSLQTSMNQSKDCIEGKSTPINHMRKNDDITLENEKEKTKPSLTRAQALELVWDTINYFSGKYDSKNTNPVLNPSVETSLKSSLESFHERFDHSMTAKDAIFNSSSVNKKNYQTTAPEKTKTEEECDDTMRLKKAYDTDIGSLKEIENHEILSHRASPRRSISINEWRRDSEFDSIKEKSIVPDSISAQESFYAEDTHLTIHPVSNQLMIQGSIIDDVEELEDSSSNISLLSTQFQLLKEHSKHSRNDDVLRVDRSNTLLSMDDKDIMSINNYSSDISDIYRRNPDQKNTQLITNDGEQSFRVEMLQNSYNDKSTSLTDLSLESDYNTSRINLNYSSYLLG